MSSMQKAGPRFTNILFSPLGDTDNPVAVRRVADLAKRNNARLTLLGVIEEPSVLQRAVHRGSYLDEIQDAEQKAMEAKLARCTPKTKGLEIESRISVGGAALSIIERVLAAEHDLVVVTSDEDDADHASIRRLLRKCPCPVWVIRPTRARKLRALAAVNPNQTEIELNKSILQLASSMVTLYGGELHVAHAWELYGEATLKTSAYLRTPEAQIEELLISEQASHELELKSLLAEAGLEEELVQVHLHKGSPTEIIPAVVAKAKINLLVMGTVARTGLTGLIMGNTAETVLDSVRCSVIAVKPPGFVSPLELVVR